MPDAVTTHRLSNFKQKRFEVVVSVAPANICVFVSFLND